MDIMTCCLGSLFTVYYIYAMHFFFVNIYLLTFIYVFCACSMYTAGISTWDQ